MGMVRPRTSDVTLVDLEVLSYDITRNHPFIDGNKRTAFLAAYTFLGINGWELNAPEDEVVRAVVGLSDRSMSAEAFAEWLRTVCRTPRRKKTE